MAWRQRLTTAFLSGFLLTILTSRSVLGQEPQPPRSPLPSSANSLCHDDAPDSCSFLCGGTCDWLNEKGWVATNASSPNWSLTLGDGNIGRLTSRTACSASGGDSGDHCLTFWYRFQMDFIITLSVLVAVEGEEGGELGDQEVWKQIRSPNGEDKWTEAHVTLNSTVTASGRGFRVTIQSERFRYDYKHRTVFVDAVHYSRSQCSSTGSSSSATTSATSLQPPEDNPAESHACALLTSTTPAPSTISMDTTTTTSVSVSSSLPDERTSVNSGSVDPDKGGDSKDTRTNGDSKETSDETGDNDGSGSSSMTAGVIVGVVFAVLAIIAIAFCVVLFAFQPALVSKHTATQRQPEKSRVNKQDTEQKKKQD